MKKLSKAYRELGIAFDFPINIKDANGNRTYCESSDGYWWRSEYDEGGRRTYYDNSNGYWERMEYDANGNETYHEDSDGYWERSEYDADGKKIYYEAIDGVKHGTPSGKNLKHFISTVTIHNGEYETLTNYCLSSDSRESAGREVMEAFELDVDDWEQRATLYSLVEVSAVEFAILRKYI